MDSIRGRLTVLGHPEADETRLRRVGRDLSLGFMAGAAIALSVFVHHENGFYQFLAFCIFAISLIVFNALNWKAVVRYFYLAVVTVTAVALVALPHFEFSSSFFLGRIPIILTSMSLLIEAYSSHRWERAPDARLVPPDIDSDVDEHIPFAMLGHGDELLVHMTGGEGEQYCASSQGSSDISLSTATGRLPSSADTVIYTFWDGLGTGP